MLIRTFLAVSLSSWIYTSAVAESSSSQLDQLPESHAIPIENLSLSKSATSTDDVAAVENSTNTPVAEPTVTTTPNTAVTQQLPAAAVTETTPTETTTQPTDPAVTTPSAPAEATTPPVKVEWTLDALNNATWAEGLERGQFPVYAKAQVLLSRNYASPGAIDGSTGMNTLKSLSTYQTMHKLEGAGVLTKETWDKLNQGNEPVFVEYTITAQDLKGPFVKSIPGDVAERAKLKGQYYTRVTELLAEKFHMDETFLKKINPNVNFSKEGQKIIVANINNKLPEDIHLIIAHKSAKQLYLFNSKNRMIAAFPATVGKEGTPSPTGTLKISNIAPNPWYSYNPTTFGKAPGKTYSIAPGPNNYVGNMWIGLSRPSFGIHGTPEPSNISKGTGSNGCVRLTNWDANNLSKHVKVGTMVRFLE